MEDEGIPKSIEIGAIFRIEGSIHDEEMVDENKEVICTNF